MNKIVLMAIPFSVLLLVILQNLVFPAPQMDVLRGNNILGDQKNYDENPFVSVVNPPTNEAKPAAATTEKDTKAEDTAKPKTVTNTGPYPTAYVNKCGTMTAACVVRPPKSISESLQLLKGAQKDYYTSLYKTLSTLFTTKYATAKPAVSLSQGEIAVEMSVTFPKSKTKNTAGLTVEKDIVPAKLQKDFSQQIDTVSNALLPVLSSDAEAKAADLKGSFTGVKVIVKVLPEDGFATEFSNDNKDSYDVDGVLKTAKQMEQVARTEYRKTTQRAIVYTNSNLNSGTIPVVKMVFFADRISALSSQALLELIIHEWNHAEAFALWRNSLIDYNSGLLSHNSSEFSEAVSSFGDAVKAAK